MLKTTIPLFLSVLLIFSCAGDKDQETGVDPVEELKSELSILIEEEISDPETADQLKALYEIQIDSLIDITLKQHNREFQKLFEDRTVETEQLEEYIQQWDEERRIFIRTMFDSEKEKRRILGDSLYKKINKKEIKLIRNSDFAQLGDES